MLSPGQSFVKLALTIEALELLPNGRELKSKRISPYFLNSGLFNTGYSLNQLARMYAKKIIGLSGEPDVLFGPAYKGTILAPAISMALDQLDMEVGFATNRKEVKSHGEGGDLIGSGMKDAKVLIIDDVITTGETKSEAIDFVRSNGGIVTGIVVAFDRQETVGNTNWSAVQLFEERHGIPVHAIATLTDLINLLRQDKQVPGYSPDVFEKILAYQKQYGVK